MHQCMYVVNVCMYVYLRPFSDMPIKCHKAQSDENNGHSVSLFFPTAIARG